MVGTFAVQALLAHTAEGTADHNRLQQVHNDFTECVQACNARLRSLEDFATLQKLDQCMDYSRLQHHAPLTQRCAGGTCGGGGGGRRED